MDGKLGKAATGKNATLGNVSCVHDGDDIVAARASSLNILQQLASYELVHVLAEVGGVQGDTALEVVEEKHDGRMQGRPLLR